MTKKIKWGVIAPGNIAQKFAESATALEEAEIVAVASRNPERAKEFAAKWSIPTTYDSYETLVNDPQVEAVYISSPHSFHAAQIVLALNAGKHVLCEKPITIRASQLQPLLELAEEKNLFLMEAMWSRHLPTYKKLKEWIDSGKLGEIKRIEADFSFAMDFDPEHRLFNPALAGGALLDVGVYPLNLAMWIMGRKPDSHVSLCRKAESGVDAAATVTMQWDEGPMAILHMAIDVRGPRSAVVSGTKGMVEMPMPFYGGEKIIFRNEHGREVFEEKHFKNGFDWQIIEAARCISGGKKESPNHTWAGTLTNMELMDEIRAQWGVEYP